MSTPIIARTSILASLNASQWSGRKFDKTVTEDLNRSKGADDDASRVNKLLVSKAILKPIQQHITQVRSEFYRRTLPWGDDAARIMPLAAYDDFSSYMVQAQAKLEQLVDEFVADYRNDVKAAARRMGGMFDINDYPKPSEMPGKFALSWSVRPIATEEDFRVDLTEGLREQLEQHVRHNIEQQTTAAMRHVWTHVGGMLEEIRDRLGDPDARFKRNLLDNFVELVHSLDDMNVAEDENLTELRRELQQHLSALQDPDALRKDTATRKATSENLAEVADRFSDLWA